MQKNKPCLFMKNLLLLAALISSLSLNGQVLPELPQIFLQTCMPISSDTITVCDIGCDFDNDQLQEAFDAAQAGTLVLLQPGATYQGTFFLREKPAGEGWIVVRTAAPDASLPDADTRITPSFSNVLPKIIAPPFLQALRTEGRAHHWFFMGIEFAAEGFSYNIVALGNGETSEADLPHDFTFDRVYAHGHPLQGSRRAFAANGKRIALVNSWVSDCKEVGADSQAFCAWSGTVFKLVNNYLEGAGENVMFGGAPPSVQGLVPSDIEVRNNYFFKPLAWALWAPQYAGTPWSVKNLFELKNAQRVLVQGNVFEQNWAHAQTGFAVLFTPRTENGTAPWSKVHDVTWEHNIIRHSAGAFNISARDDSWPTDHTQRILIRNNLLEDLNGQAWGGGVNRVFQVLNGVQHLTIEHNTVFNSGGGTFLNADGPQYPNFDFVFRNNIVAYGDYGAHGSGLGVGNNAIQAYFPQAEFRRNAIADGTPNNGGVPANYPPDNFFPPKMTDVGFVNYNNGLGGDYHLSNASPYRNAATDGSDVGTDMDSLASYTSSAVPGIFESCSQSVGTVAPPLGGSAHLEVFPNPSNGLVAVALPSLADETTLTATDLMGQILHLQTVFPGQSVAGVDLTMFPPGVYFLNLMGVGKVARLVKR